MTVPSGAATLRHRRWPLDGVRPGDEAGRGALLVVHGLSEHSGRYAEMAEAVNAAGLLVFGVDLYGHGDSPGPRGHVRGFDVDHLGAVDELVRRAEREAPELPIFLLGHSLGGLIVARWAQSRVFARRLGGLILLSPFVAPRMRLPRWKLLAARLTARVRPSFSLPTGIEDEDVFRDPAEQARFASDPLVQRRISAGHWTELGRERARLRERSDDLPVPALVLLAGEDRIVDTSAARAFAERLPEATIVEYPEAFHALHHDPATPRVIDDLLRWVDARLRA